MQHKTLQLMGIMTWRDQFGSHYGEFCKWINPVDLPPYYTWTDCIEHNGEKF